MSVRFKFVLVLTLVVSIILVSSFFIIYNLFRHNQKQDFNNRLWANAYNQYLTYYNIQNTHKATLDKLNANLSRSPVNLNSVLLDGSYHLIATNPSALRYEVDTSFLQKVRSEKEIYFKKDNLQGVALYINKGGKEAYVITTGCDKYTLERLSSLRFIMI